MGILRSDTMQRGVLVLQADTAKAILEELGRKTKIHFEDMNKDTMVRQYRTYSQRTDEMSRILRFLVDEIEAVPSVTIHCSLRSEELFLQTDLETYVFEKVEEVLKQLYTQFQQFKENNSRLVDNFVETLQEIGIVHVACNINQVPILPVLDSIPLNDVDNAQRKLLDANEDTLKSIRDVPTETDSNIDHKSYGNGDDPLVPSVGIDSRASFNLVTSLSGIINSNEIEGFSKVVFRASHGTAYVSFYSLSDIMCTLMPSYNNENGNTSTDIIYKVIQANLAAVAASTYKHSNSARDSLPGGGVDIGAVFATWTVFLIYFQGDWDSPLYKKLKEACTKMGSNIFQWPRDSHEAKRRFSIVSAKLLESAKTLDAFNTFFAQEISLLLKPTKKGGSSQIEEWRLFCLKERLICDTLNKFDGQEAVLKCICWYPASSENAIRDFLRDVANAKYTSAFMLSYPYASTTNVKPPTLIRTCALTEPFQELVDTYGVPAYQEANPALFAVILFPFLFGIMYGDIGHGLCIVIVAGVLFALNRKNESSKTVNTSNKPDSTMIGKSLKPEDTTSLHDGHNDIEIDKNDVKNDQLKNFFKARWMVLLMGLFAVYIGFLYNDFISLGFDIFGTRFIPTATEGETEYFSKNPNKAFPYPFGLDPSWKGAKNELTFVNSMKMKIAVIIAFMHMLSGIMFKLWNSLYFSDYIEFFCVGIPQVIFFSGLIGYMDFLIVIKWAQDETHNKPSIINTFINMCMFGTVDPEDQLYSAQPFVERMLLVACALSAVYMLFAKPIVLLTRHKDDRKRIESPRKDSELQMFEDMGEDSHKTHSTARRRRNSEYTAVATHEHASADTGDIERGAFVHQGTLYEDAEKEEHNEAGDIWVHSIIEMIEFVLGTISNTASYLRLWALSLAHQQLALVFFNYLVLIVLDMDLSVLATAIALLFSFSIFEIVTFGILLCMDLMECFLHALRLQWVEFQSKFYKGDGFKFVPFDFLLALQNGLEAE